MTFHLSGREYSKMLRDWFKTQYIVYKKIPKVLQFVSVYAYNISTVHIPLLLFPSTNYLVCDKGTLVFPLFLWQVTILVLGRELFAW